MRLQFSHYSVVGLACFMSTHHPNRSDYGRIFTLQR